ncbi:MAG TPA: fused MFS/spermidine synthase, partial [Planctomycetota bacterium]|nr:fused MFS/spermidine synthase [Planctomycetota bacterium]
MEKRAIPGALVLASAASGAAALVYEVLWVRRLGDLIGSTAHAVAAVLSVFFLGLGLGAWILGRQADRIAEPWRLFVALELLVAAWGIGFWWLSGWIDELYVAAAPAQLSAPAGALAKGAMALALLLPPATAMGGALPALVRHAVRRASDYGPRLGVLYGANTLGGAAGVLGAVFLLMPGLGLIETGLVAAALNLTAAGCAWTARRPTAEVPDEARTSRDEASTPARVASARSGAALLAAAFLAGAVSIGLEVLWTRALAMRFSSTIYSFGIILAAFLLGLGLGALATGWLDRRGLVGGMAAAATMALSGIAGLVSTAVLARIEPLATAGAGAPASFAALA